MLRFRAQTTAGGRDQDSIRRLTRWDAVAMSTVAGVSTAIYAAARTGPHWQLVLVLGLSMPFTAAVWAWADVRANGSVIARDAVYAAGALIGVATITAVAAADGGTSPLIAFYFPLVAFMAVAATTWLTLVLLAITLVCYLVAAGSADAASVLIRTVSLSGLAAVSMLQARAQRRARHRLREASLRDRLTSLPNRALLTDRLHHAVSTARRRPERHLAVAFIDLDDFKAVNDTLGHRMGDDLLRIIAPRLVRDLRDTDTLARFGGDEFVVLMEDLDGEDEALKIVERILAALHEPATVGGQAQHLRGSAGLVMGQPRYWDDPEALLRDADTAMYRAKAGGGGRVEVFDDETRDRVMHRTRIARDLRAAVTAGDQFELVYQPLVDLRTGAATRVEALLRWRHEDPATADPAVFIPIAERSGVIGPIGEWVLHQACAQARQWAALPALRDVRVSVNVSAAQIGPGKDFPDVVGRVLDATGLAPAALALEITETTLIESPAETARTLAWLADLGIGVHLDDFGTGYSSLSSVLSFPLAAIKLDRSFVAEIHDPRHLAVVRSVIELGRGLGLTTVAEGVETVGQLATVIGLGCDYAQGFLFSRPVRADDVPALAQRGFGTVIAAAGGRPDDGPATVSRLRPR